MLTGKEVENCIIMGKDYRARGHSLADLELINRLLEIAEEYHELLMFGLVKIEVNEKAHEDYPSKSI